MWPKRLGLPCQGDGPSVKAGQSGRPTAHRGKTQGPVLGRRTTDVVFGRGYRSGVVASTEPCAECGFVYDLDEAPMAADRIRSLSGELADQLGRGDVGLVNRPHPTTWSVLEYGCHVRDVLLVQRGAVLEARRVDAPSVRPMGRDDRVEHDGYADQHPSDVARQLGDAASLLANDLDRLRPDWDHTVIYNYPTRAERSLRWVAVHTVHECRHHLLDVRHQLPAIE